MEKENKNINQNNPEQEFPDWMLVESDSDPMLLNMIQIREDIMTPIVEKGGFMPLTQEMKSQQRPVWKLSKQLY